MSDSVRELVEKGLKDLDPKLGYESETWPYAQILLASVLLGADETAIEKELEADSDFVAMVAARLRKNGIWKGRRVATRETYFAESGGIAFWLDVSVAEGKATRSGGAKSGRYQMTPEGRKYVETRLLRS